MKKNRKNLFQVLLLILALVFVIAIRYVCETRTAQAGTFSKENSFSTVTFSDVYNKFCESGASEK